ncbi:unnamed protein product, partial [Linum tenue]
DAVIELTQRFPVFKHVVWDKVEYIFSPVQTDKHYRVYAADLRSQKTFLLDNMKPKPAVAKVDHGPMGKIDIRVWGCFPCKAQHRFSLA